MIKYNSFWINTKTVKCLLEQLQQIYNELKDENEMVIIKKYGYNAKCYTIRIILITVCSVFVISFLSIWPRLLDIIVPMNESRPHYEIEFIAEYFPDQEKYYYVIILHMNAAICIGGIAFIATGTMLIAYLKHACGMFKIASYRIDQAIAINFLQNIEKNEIITYKKITYAVDIHRKAMKFAEYLISNFEGSFFVLIAVTVCCLSLNLFQIYRAVLLQDNEKEFLLHFLIVFIILLYMFLANYAGQEIIDHNNHIYSTAYNIHWYVMPLHVQKLILFLLQRSSKSFSLNIGGLFVASLQCFASLSSTSISYFTVIYSTQ
ncbi:odorant receptor 4-like isoform X2 [Camponotus floridanus]|nr:odorant receptor 4-like isoform X2 [Camponotus floridanus]